MRPIETGEVTRVESPAGRRSRPPLSNGEERVPDAPVTVPDARVTVPDARVTVPDAPVAAPEAGPSSEALTLPRMAAPLRSVSPWEQPVELDRELLPSSLMPPITDDHPVDEGRRRAERVGTVVWIAALAVTVVAGVAMWLAT